LRKTKYVHIFQLNIN